MAELGRAGAPLVEAEKSARQEGECRSCKAPIYWVQVNGRPHPVDRGREQRVVFIPGTIVNASTGERAVGEWKVVGSYKSHFASCPDREQWRKK